jgi:Bromodomain extra-terminal - transcription regulation
VCLTQFLALFCSAEDNQAAAATTRKPSLMDKKMFSQNLYNISSEDLGRVVHLLDEKCEKCIKKIDPEDIEIEIDEIDDLTFWTVDAFVKTCLPGGKKGAGGAGGAAGASSSSSSSSSAAAGPSQPKKARKE